MSTGRPFVSVVIPTRGRPGALSRCLASLAAQDYGTDAFETIVVDDGSTVPVAVHQCNVSDRLRVTMVRQAQTGPAGARNHGLRVARGDYVAFIDDDCEASIGWLRHLVQALEQHPGAGAGGPVINALSRNMFAETSQSLVSFLCAYYNADPERARFFTSNNLAFPRAALLEAGGFDDKYQRAAAEDRELCDRWSRQGRRLVSAPDASVRHAHDLTLRTFWRQHFTYGSGAWHYWRHRAAGSAARLTMEPWQFYRRLLLWPVRTRHLSGLPVMLLLVVAQLANAAGFFVEARRSQ